MAQDDKRGRHPGRHPAQRPLKLVNYEPKEPTPPEQVPADVKEALKVAEWISRTIDDDIPERKKLKNPDYFESTEARAQAIADTIERTNRVTQAQRTALDNILAGLLKWVD